MHGLNLIRKFQPSDKDIFIEMAIEFYNSPAVMNPIPEVFHYKTFEEIIRSEDYLCGYFFEYENKPAGFCVTAKTYSPEAGGIVIIIEDLYIRPEFRSKGLGSVLFKELEENGDPRLKRLRLEISEDNTRAISLYERLGFKRLPYGQMYKEL